MIDPYNNFNSGGDSHALPIDAPAENLFAITPSDTQDLPFATRSLLVGGQGDVKVDAVGIGTAVVLPSVSGVVPVRVTRVYATDTAGDLTIVGLF